MMVFEGSRGEVVDFVCPYRVEMECKLESKAIFNGEEMKEVDGFKYLELDMCKDCGVEGETREKALQGREATGIL